MEITAQEATDYARIRALIRRFEEKQPEIVFHWKDRETEAEGWLVINSLKGGSAGGGTRMRRGLDKREVESLAKTMEIKFSVSGPPIGGAKSGINFDASDPRKKGVLERWFKAVAPILKAYYGTGGDYNVDEIHEVIPITESFDIRHPQEGTVNGHFKAKGEQKERIISQLRQGVKKILDDPAFSPDIDRQITVADMITGYGVAESVGHLYRIAGKEIVGKKAIIQGWGNVGAAAGYYLSNMGVLITGIIDRNGGLLNENGFSPEEVRALYLNRNGNLLHSPDLLTHDEVKDQIWHSPVDIFVPAASSRLVHKEHIQSMLEKGLEVIACGANVPFADQEIFFGPITEFADSTLSLIPDFVANCGMARVFSYLMNDGALISDEAIFNDVSICIGNALQEIVDRGHGYTGLNQSALEIAIEKSS